ncbi:hypothetical protein M3221_13515 [Domibacillus indicus]|uniref:hypothetical protein n=1 Tax=Domibacillus indicus TaxID=1437523 RepID=UPI00203E09BD|nr:hypothetical protein [Domibacillus indicus]MCM3789418.1 hypothetical protein [Domibacillus indicus]
MAKTQVNKAQELLGLIKQQGSKGAVNRKGMTIVTADSSSTLIFEGSANPVSMALFEIPAEYLPLEPFARYFAVPIGDNPTPNRWGIIQRLDNKGLSEQIQVSNGSTVTTYTLKNGIFVAAN